MKRLHRIWPLEFKSKNILWGFSLGVFLALAAKVEHAIFDNTPVLMGVLSHYADPDWVIGISAVYLALMLTLTPFLPSLTRLAMRVPFLKACGLGEVAKLTEHGPDRLGKVTEQGLIVTASIIAGLGFGTFEPHYYIRFAIVASWFAVLAYAIRQLRLKGLREGWSAFAWTYVFTLTWGPPLH